MNMGYKKRFTKDDNPEISDSFDTNLGLTYFDSKNKHWHTEDGEAVEYYYEEYPSTEMTAEQVKKEVAKKYNKKNWDDLVADCKYEIKGCDMRLLEKCINEAMLLYAQRQSADSVSKGEVLKQIGKFKSRLLKQQSIDIVQLIENIILSLPPPQTESKPVGREVEQQDAESKRVEIDFCGHVKARFIVAGGRITVTDIMNGYGDRMDETKVKIEYSQNP